MRDSEVGTIMEINLASLLYQFFFLTCILSRNQAVQLESSSSVRVRYLIIVSTLSNKQESVLLGMDFPNSERCVWSTFWRAVSQREPQIRFLFG